MSAFQPTSSKAFPGTRRPTGFLGAFLAAGLLLSGCAERRAFQGPFSQSSPRRIAVLPFESSNPYVPGIVLSDYFTVQILQSIPSLQVIERKDLIKILQEQKLSLTGVLRQDKFARLGSVLGVDAILIGSVQTLETVQSVGGAIAVTIKLMEVNTGKVLWADRQKIDHATWSAREVPEIADRLMEKAAQKMVRAMEKRWVPQATQVLPGEAEPLREARLTEGAPKWR